MVRVFLSGTPVQANLVLACTFSVQQEELSAVINKKQQLI